MIPFLIYVTAIATLNHCAGNKWFGLTGSTEIGRIASAIGAGAATQILAASFHYGTIASINTGLWCAMAFFLWRVFAWDAYWSAEIGNDPFHSRLWGLAMMTLRMLLAIPMFAGLALITYHTGRLWFSVAALFMGVPYFIFGYFSKAYAIPRSEYLVGTIIAITNYFILAQEAAL